MLSKTNFYQLLENNRVILINALSLIGTFGITSGVGFAFWWLVARKFELVDAGLASASISAMYLLGTFGMLGMGTLLIGELARRPQIQGFLIITASLTAALGSFILGVGFPVVAAYFSPKFAFLTASWGNILLFATGVSVTGLTLVLDQALLGLLRGNWQLWRNAVFASSKLLLLLPMGHFFMSKGAMVIYAAWLLGNVLSLVFLLFFVGRNQIGRINFQPQWAVLWEMRSIAAAHHVLNLSLQAAQFALPVIVTVLLEPEVNASFYVAWLIVTSFFIIPSALTQTLYAVSSADNSILAQKIRFTLRTSFLGVIVGGITLVIMARFILGFFNPSYAQTATSSLQILLLAGLPVVIRVHYVAIHQIRRQIKQAAWKLVAIAILELSFAIGGGILGGLPGLSIGWVLAMHIEGLLMVSTVYRTAFQTDNAPGLVKSAITEES